VLALIRRGVYAGGREAKHAAEADTEKARERFLDKLKASEDRAERLARDMAEKAEVSRLEALLHPQFLLESVRARELEQALDPCHQRTALVVGLKTDPGRAGSEPARDLRGLLELMEGLATPQWEGPMARSRVMPLRAHVLLEAGDGDLSLMARLLPEMPGRFLWLASPAGGDRVVRLDEESLAASARLMKAFTGAAMEILGFRRAGETVTVGGEDAFPVKWHRMMERYRRCVGHLAARHRLEAGPVLRELPGVLCFGLGFLCRHSAPDQGTAPAMDAIMREAFRAAWRLARRHCRELSLFLNAERVEQGLELARQIVAKLEEKGPLNHRGLARCFGNQRKERFEPVIAALLRLGVLVRRDDGTLATGEEELAEVEDGLRQALLAPAPAEPAAAKADRSKAGRAKSKAPGTTRRNRNWKSR